MVYLFDSLDLITADEYESELERLPRERKEQALSYRNQTDRIRNVWAYKLLKDGLKRDFGISEVPALKYDSFGKPFFDGLDNIFFNLSHCRKAVACVIDRVPVGIDVETIRDVSDGLLDYTCSEEEKKAVKENGDANRAFTRLWTVKESYLKAVGTGIRGSIRTILDDIPAGTEFETVYSESKEYFCTVCRLRGGARV